MFHGGGIGKCCQDTPGPSDSTFHLHCSMDNSIRLILVACSLVLVAGCSVQKRALMPGYHVEWGGTPNSMSTADSPTNELDQLDGAVADILPYELPAAALARPSLIRTNLRPLAHTRSIPPSVIPLDPVPTVLADPTPWAETYEEQKKYGNFTLAALGLVVLLAANGASALVLNAALFAAAVSFILNRRKRREVIDIKELNGYDVTEERKQFRTTNRLLGGAVFATVIAYIVLVIMLVSAFIVFWESLFNW